MPDKVRRLRPSSPPLRAVTVIQMDDATAAKLPHPMIEGVEPRAVQTSTYMLHEDGRNAPQLGALVQDGWEIKGVLRPHQVQDSKIVETNGQPKVSLAYELLIQRRIF